MHVVVFQISSTWIVLAHVQCVKSMEAPKYFWKFNSSEQMNHCKNFVLNIQTFNAEYSRDLSSYRTLLPTPIKCPFTDSCNGGIESSCTEGYEGTLCATCSSNLFLRFNRCLECPSMLVRVTSCVLVIVVFIFLFLLIFWGDSNAANGERGCTEADVVMTCVKVVVGFYQAASGIFSAVLQVQWPVVLVSMEKYLKFVEGNNSHHWPHQPSVSTGSIHAILSFYLFQYLSNSVDTDVLIT